MMKIRRITDINTLLNWRREVIINVFDEKPDQKLMEANQEYYEKHIPNGTHMAFVAFKDDNAEADQDKDIEDRYDFPGMGCGSICFTEELPSPDNPSGKCGYLMNIYVRDRFRDHGIGHEIVRHLIEEARNYGCGKIYLETTDLGRSLYESLGFKDLPDMMKLAN